MTDLEYVKKKIDLISSIINGSKALNELIKLDMSFLPDRCNIDSYMDAYQMNNQSLKYFVKVKFQLEEYIKNEYIDSESLLHWLESNNFMSSSVSRIKEPWYKSLMKKIRWNRRGFN